MFGKYSLKDELWQKSKCCEKRNYVKRRWYGNRSNSKDMVGEVGENRKDYVKIEKEKKEL